MRLSVLSFGGSIALTLLTLSAAAPQATAGAIYDNLAQTSAGILGTTNGGLGDSFSIDATAVTLTDVQLLLEASNPADGATFAVVLFPDEGMTPVGGAPLGFIIVADSSLTGSLADYDYVFSTPVALAANTRYWIAVGPISGVSSVQWSYDTTNGGTGAASEYNIKNTTVFANSANTPFQMQVNVISATPEPASWALTIVSGVCVAVFMARRRDRIAI